MKAAGAPSGFSCRLATEDDLSALAALVEASTAALVGAVLDPTQTALAHAIMGLDPELIVDRSYFIAMDVASGRIAGAGGWSLRVVYRAGGYSTPERDAAMAAMPADAARIRAMYTHPDFARRGVGRLILDVCEDAARRAGFARVELMATLAGEGLYRACGYQEIERFAAATRNGVSVPGIRMGKTLAEP